MSERTSPARLEGAFIAASRLAWPDLSWLPGSWERALRYPQMSPTLGNLEVWFDDDEITLCFGPKGYHQHHGIYEPLSAPELALAEQRVATEVVDVIRALLADEVVVRWGVVAVTVHRRKGTSGKAAQWWRRVTPWVREAVWSGQPRG